LYFIYSFTLEFDFEVLPPQASCKVEERVQGLKVLHQLSALHVDKFLKILCRFVFKSAHPIPETKNIFYINRNATISICKYFSEK